MRQRRPAPNSALQRTRLRSPLSAVSLGGCQGNALTFLSAESRASVAAALATVGSVSFFAGAAALTGAAFAHAEQPPWLALVISLAAGSAFLLFAVRLEGSPPRRTFLRRATLPGGIGSLVCLLSLLFSCGPHPDPGLSGLIAFCVSALNVFSFLTALRQVECRESQAQQ